MRRETLCSTKSLSSSASFLGTCLVATRSRRGSDMPPACHSLPRRRFATAGEGLRTPCFGITVARPARHSEHRSAATCEESCVRVKEKICYLAKQTLWEHFGWWYLTARGSYCSGCALKLKVQLMGMEQRRRFPVYFKHAVKVLK